MMLSWWGYTFAVGAIASAAAALTATGQRAAGRPTRWIWAAALLVSSLWPALAAVGWQPFAPFERFDIVDPAGAATGTGSSTAVGALLAQADTWLLWMWAVMSGVLILLAATGEIALHLRCRRRIDLPGCGITAWVSSDAGPATFGVFRPRIVLPRWVLQASDRERRLILIHELQHVRAGDVQLLWIAFGVVCAMPWNPVAWWQYGRLRAAVEIDCDRRCLRRHVDARRYGEILLRAARAASLPALPAVGLLERRRLLVARIEQIAEMGRQGSGLAPWLLDPRCIGAPNPWQLALVAAACLLGALVLPAPARESLETVVTAKGSSGGGVAGVIRRTPASAADDPQPVVVIRATGVSTLKKWEGETRDDQEGSSQGTGTPGGAESTLDTARAHGRLSRRR